MIKARKIIMFYLIVLFLVFVFANKPEMASKDLLNGSINKEKSEQETLLGSFPIYKIGNHIFTKVKLDNDEKLWVLDTGADDIVIDSAYAKDHNLIEKGSSVGDGAAGKLKLTIYSVPKLVIDTITVENLIATSFNINEMFRKVYNVEVGGVLGSDFFSKYVVKIDYDTMYISLFDPQKFEYSGAGSKLKFQLVSNIIYVPLKINNKDQGQFVFDTGAGTTILSYQLAIKNKITSLNGLEYKAKGAGKDFIIKLVLIPDVEFGSYILKNIVIGYPLEKSANGLLTGEEFDGTIGINILGKFIIYIDYLNKVIYLEKGKNFTHQYPYNKSGMQFELNNDGNYEIVYISKGSAAQRAGFKIGDFILKINGQKPEEIGDINYLKTLFEADEGTRYRIQIKRGNEEKDLDLILENPFKQ